MGKWQDNAKQSIVNRNSDTSSQSNTTTAGAKSSDSWQQQAKQSLDNRGYIPPENRAYEIKINNGTNFGTVSYGAYKAIQNDTLDRYVPKNDDEKQVLDSYRQHVSATTPKTETEEPQGRNATFWDLTVNSLKRGFVQSLYGQESYKAMMGQKNNKAWYEEKLKSKDYSFIPDAWYEKALSGSMELLGQQVKQWIDPRSLAAGTAAAGTAFVAGQAGPQVAIPEEVITVPGAFFSGIAAGSATANFEIEAGLAYNEMIENGVSHETARNIALGVGAGNATLEMVQIDDLIKSFKVLNVDDATKPAAKKILSYLKERGINVVSETAQEVAQETVTATGANIANKIDKGEWVYDWGEIGQRIGETAVSSAMSFGLLGTGGDVINYGVNKTVNTIANKRNAPAMSATVTPVNAETDTNATANDISVHNRNINAENTVIPIQNIEKGFNFDVNKIDDTTSLDTQVENDVTPQITTENDTEQTVKTENIADDTTATKPIADNTSVSVGDVFENKRSGNTMTVLGRNAEGTTIEIDTGTTTETRKFSNSRADELVTSEQFERVGSVDIPTTEPKNITLTRMGDFYEAFGNEALELAGKLNLMPTYKVVNGVKTAMVGFPMHTLKAYQNKLGNTYNLVVSNNTDSVFTNDMTVNPLNSTETVNPTTEMLENSTQIKNGQSVTNISEQNMSYTDKEKQNWENSNKIIVYENDEQFENFVEKVLKNEDTHKKIYFGKIPTDTAQRVLDKTGIDVSEHNIALKGYEIRKILLNSHGNKSLEIARGQEPITVNDLKKIPSVITNPDDVKLSDKKYEGKPALLFEKNIDGKNYVVAYVSRKHHDIAIQTMYKKRSLATAENANALSSTSKTTNSTASDNSIAQNNDIVNNSVSNNAENMSDTDETAPVGQLFKDYDNAVDNIVSVSDETAKEMADKRVAVEVLKNTPNVILENVKGARDLKVIINYNKLYLAVRKDGVFKGHYHNLGTEIAKKLPEFLQNPDAVIQLANGRLNLFATVETERGNNGIISVELNSTKDIGGKYEDYNVVVTMFSSADNYAENLISGKDVSIKYKKEDLSQVNPQLYKWLAIINDKSSSDNIVSQDNNDVNNSVRNNAENDTIDLTDKCELIPTKHTKTGDDIWVVALKDRLSSEEYKDLNVKVKAIGGYYSRYAETPDGKAMPGFIFKSEPTEKELSVFNDFFDNTLQKKTDSDTIKTNKTEEVNGDGIDESGKTLENDERYSEVQTKGEIERVQNRSTERLYSVSDGGNDGERYRNLSTRVGKSEKRSLSSVVDDEKFKKLKSFIGNEISVSKYKELKLKYNNDIRIDNGYEFSEVIAYDMLTDENNSLRETFADNIAEYFNTSTDVTEDITGAKVSDDILNATKNSVVKNENGIEVKENDTRTESIENDNRLDEIQTQKQTREVQERVDKIDIGRRGVRQRNKNTLEERTLYDVCQTEKFERLKNFVGNEVSETLSNKLIKKYSNDTRLFDGNNLYDVTDLVAYDMLTDENNSLRETFADNIAEYFNASTDVTEDITGAKVSDDILNATKNSVVKNENGQLIPVYHGTDTDFDVFRRGDVGIHFGSYSQAVQRVNDKGIKEPIYKKAYLNIENPLVVDEDFYGWNAFQIAQKLNKMGLLTNDEALKYVRNNKNDVNKANDELISILKRKGFDGVIYNNEFEAMNGKSYIAFGNDQVFTVNQSEERKEIENAKSKSKVLAGESVSNGGGLHTGTSGIDERKGTQGTNEPHRDSSGEILSESAGTDGSRPDVGNDSERIYGSDDGIKVGEEVTGASGNGGRGELLGRGDGTVHGIREGTGQRVLNSQETLKTIDTEVKTVEKKRPSNKGNFVITNDMATEFDNTAPNTKDNLEAIELLLKLENEGRAATAEEKKILAKYKGWGGIDTRTIPYPLNLKFDDFYKYEEREAMQSSRNNAFFTPTKVIDAMYTGLKRLGFKGGNVLETSMGVGNFFGRMPKTISGKSALTGIELESYTARIAQYLYPGATVINMPFQDVAIKNGSYDLVIGNVPFGQNKISYNKKKYSLHNYFIISSLDKVRDGGIVAVITSAGTLDSHSIDARKAIMDKADVVACYKLPEKVFSRNAKTDVQSDLLILKKRANGSKSSGDSILNTVTTKDGLRINEYFEKHPENILGTLAKGTNAWGEITTVLNDGNFYDKLDSAMKKLPKDLISGKTELKPVETIVSLSDKPRFFEKSGQIYADDGAGTATAVSKNQESTVRDYMAVRDAYKELLGAYEQDLSDSEIEPLRQNLSRVYDNFYKQHGAITGDGKKKIGKEKSKNNTFLEADADYYLVGGLERYDAKNKEFTKSALFDKDTLRKKKVTSVDFASDALAVSLNETGKIDFARMQELTGKNEKQLAEELKGEIVLTPEGDYVLTDIYLSGNIYEKLEAVKGKAEFKEQQEMLEKVIPVPKNATDITVKLGANYIDTSYIEQFAREVLKSHLTIRKDVSGRWVIEGVRQSRYGDVVNVKYGCDAFNAVQLLEKILNDSDITATKKLNIGGKKSTTFDAEMTDIAKQKADDIRSAFEDWIFKDTNRRNDIVDKYNRTYNNYKPIDYERIAEKLSFDSMDKTIKSKLYPHQRKGIARFLFGGNTLFAHGVGTGKTFEMIASVMEAKRMGFINKAAMVVPNNKVVDFRRDIAQAYSNAKVLVIDTANKKRQTMLGLVNSNDWDIILIARTTFTKIPVSRELQAHYTAQQLEDINIQIAEAEHDRSVSQRQLKGMTKQRDSLKQKIKDLDAETNRDETSVDFEKLGIDCICVDEAHNYKSIITPTKLDIKGLVNRNNAQMANDMLMKLDYLRSVDGKIIFGTGTPITNTVSEIYNMMRMVRPDILEDAGIHSLDEWVNTFAKIDTVTEIGIDNQIKKKPTQIIRSFVNVSEMVGMFRQFADIVFTKDVVKNLPKEKYIDVKIDGTDEHRKIQQQISETLATAEKSQMLKMHGQLMSMADAASVDLRMLSGADSEYNIFKDRSVDELEYENSKINVMCDKVYEEYTSSNDIRGTQIIFCDKGSGTGTVYSFNLHKDIMQKLIKRGIPEEQIVIVKNQSDAQLEQLYDKVNDGEVRVLIGTSQKMAEGLNVQKRVVAIHHPTVTYKPSDWEQGNARGVRAGNINDEVRIYRYLQEKTFDSHKWQAQDRKGEMINKALRGELVGEMEDIGADEDGGASIDAATAMAITSGNPLVKEKIDIDKEVTHLKTLQRNYMNEVYRYQDSIAKNPDLIKRLTTYADNIEKDISIRDSYTEKASITIKDKAYTKQSDANKALSEAIKTAPKNGKYTNIGKYNGFDIMFKGDTGGMNYSLVLKGSNEYSVDYAGNGNNIARISGVLGRLDAELTRVRDRVQTLKTDLDFAKQEVNKPFEKETELAEAVEKQKDVTYRYEHYGEKTDTDTVDTDSGIHYSLDGRNSDNRNNINTMQKHTPEQIKIMKEYENAVDNTLLDFIKYAREHKNDNRTTVTLSEVSDRCANDIKALTGVDVANFEHSIKVNTIRHIDDGHGINGNADHSMADDRDIARIQYVIDNYDDIELLDDKSKEYRDKNQKQAPMIKLSKRIDGTYYVVEAVPDTKKHQLPIISAYKNKAVEQQALIMQKENLSPQLHAQDVVADTAYDESVSQTDDNVKDKNTQNSIKSSKDIADIDDVSRWTTGKMDDAKNKGVNIADIVESVSKKFGIPIATGKVDDRQASGIYKDKPEIIRTRIANNLPTISHELGHHLDKLYNLSSLDSVKELRKAVSEDFLEQYSANEKNSEAVAEFVRIYLKNANDANKLSPDFYTDFVQTLSKKDLKAINKVATSVNEYLSYGLAERYDAAIVSSKKKEKVPFKEKWHKWYTNWVDKFHPKKQVVDYVEKATGETLSGKNNAYKLATNSLNAHAVANFLVCEGFRDLDGNIVDAKSFVDSIGMVDSKNVQLLDRYLVLRHSLEWIAPQEEDVAVKRVFADDTLENAGEIRKQIADIEEKHPEIKTAAENLYEYQNNILKYFVISAGGMTEDMLAMLNRKYPSYVPFYRAVGKKSGAVKGTFANQRSPIMRAKGSGELIISPTESIICNTEKMVKFALKNQTMQVLTDYADDVEGFGQFMDKVTPDMLPHSIDITAQKEQFADALQQAVHSSDDYFAVSDLFEEIFGETVSDFTPIANSNKKIVTVMRNGKAEYYQIHDDALYKAVAELSPQQLSGMLKIMNSVMQPMKLLITQNNPIFATTNAIRDYNTAYKLSEINNPVTFAAMYVKAFGEIIANSENYKQYKAMGGGHSSELSASVDDITKTLRKVAQKDMGKARRLVSAMLHPVTTVASINDIVESTPRFMEFMRTLENGGDLQEAIYNADDISTNFKRSGGGATAKAVNTAIMFNNAAIQGVDKTVRTLTDKNPKKRLAHLSKFLLVAVIGGLVRHFWNKEVDEEGYKNLSSYKKNNFYNYAIGDGKFISLPKERENAILDSLVERVLERAMGNDEAFYDFGGYIASQLLPPMIPNTLNPVDAVHSVMGSTVLGGLIDVGFNQDFKGTPIESEYEKYLPSNERYTESTSLLAYGLGQTKLARAIDMSPKKIDHLISSYTGIIGQANKALLPKDGNRRDFSVGLRNKFISDSNYSTDLLNRMYENKEKAEKAFAYNGTIETAVEYEQNVILTGYISSMNKAVKALSEDEQRNGRAYLLKALNQWEYDNTSSQTEMLKRFSDEAVTDDCIITSIPKSTLEWTENKVKYSYQMTPQEYTEYIKDYLNMVDKYRTYQNKECSNRTDYVLALSKTNTEVKKVLLKKYKQKYADKAEKIIKD